MKRLIPRMLAVFLTASMIIACQPGTSLKEQKFKVKLEVKGASATGAEIILFDTLMHSVNSDTNPRLISLLNNPVIMKLDSVNLKFELREGLPYDETYYSITTMKELDDLGNGSGFFGAYQTMVGGNWVKPRMGRMVQNMLRYEDISDHGAAYSPESNAQFRIHGESFLFRVEDNDPKVPPVIPQGDPRCIASFCMGTDTLTQIIFGVLNSVVSSTVSSVSIPAVSVAQSDSAGNSKMFLVPHVESPTTGHRLLKGFGFIYQTSLDIRPLNLVTSHEVAIYIPIFLVFERDGLTSYRVALVPPDVENVMVASDKIAVASTGLFQEQIAELIRDSIVSGLEDLTLPNIIPNASPDEVLSMVFNTMRNGNIPENFNIVARPLSGDLPSNQLIDFTGMQSHYEIICLEE